MLKTLSRPLVALLIAVFVFSQGTWALAGTTGGLYGVVTDTKAAPVAGATVTAASPSGTATTTTDSSGTFRFLSLSPDTYTVSVDKSGFSPASQAGVTVFADNQQSVNFRVSTLKEIGSVTSRSSNSYVKSGTTNDVYSVNAATQEALQGLGGGGNLNSAYSAVYGTPGVTSFTGNYGFGQVFFIRGGNYDQSGYEYDGVPVNRSFDNYNANSLSTLGQQELQVYTGSSPAGAASATQVGFINQVIRTGTYPGFGSAGLGIGGPGFYHEAKGEAGGATPNRLFSYYVGVEGVNQAYNVWNNNNAGNINPNGNNAYGFTGPGSNIIYGTLDNFGRYANGPFAACNADGSAPAGAATTGGYALGDPGIPACTYYGPIASLYNNMNQDREFVTNFHFGIPHKRDSGRDDVQLLFYNFGYRASSANSINQAYGGYGNVDNYYRQFPRIYNDYAAFGFVPPTYAGQGGPYNNLCSALAFYSAPLIAATNMNCSTTVGGTNIIPFSDGYIFPNGTSFLQPAAGLAATPFLFPGSPSNRKFGSGMPADYADGIWNDGAVVKLQYQKNINANSYLRLVGYTFYSDWLQNAASAGTEAFNAVLPTTFFADPVYELNTHTRGVEVAYANQINNQNLLTANFNYSTASVLRDNFTSGGPNWLATLGSTVTNFTDGTNCYSRTTGAAASCYSAGTAGTYGNPTAGLGGGTGTPNCAAAPLAGTAACAAGATMRVTVPGRSGGYLNRVTPAFSSVSLNDQFRPNDKLNLDVGLRLENYTYKLANGSYPENDFWYAQARQSFCYDPGTGLPMTRPISATTPPGSINPIIAFGACPVAPSGVAGVHPDGVGGHQLLTDAVPASFNHSLVSPRISGTYTLNPDTVVRFSAGRFTQPTPTAFEEYLFGSGKIAPTQSFGKFFPLGFTTPGHDNPVQVSTNFDFSLEKHIKGTDMSYKLTPFYRYGTNQTVNVSLAPNFISGVNVGSQRTKGFEFAFQKGDPGREGLSAQLAVTLVHSGMKYNSIGVAQNAIDVFNNYIRTYNGLTSYCATQGAAQAATSPTDNSHLCPAGNGVSNVAAPCYNANTGPAARQANSPGGFAAAPAPCGASTITNPYYTAAAQPLLDRNGYYEPYVNFPPGDPQSGAGNTALSPLQLSGYLSWKHNKLTVTPNFTLTEGNLYGDPTAVVGLDPRNCGNNQANAADNAAPIGAAYGGLPDYQSCSFSPYNGGGQLAIPNPYSGKFDNMGQYRNPWWLNMGAQIKYEVSPKMTATLLLANLVNRCFGGSSQPWSQAYAPNNYVCGYGDNTGSFVGTQPGAGFFYNGSGSDPANGTAGYPKVLNYPYAPLSGALPFQAYFLLNFKI